MESTTMDEIVHRVSNVAEEVGASVCFGAPVERDGHTLIPVARVSFGYGMGFGRGTGSARRPSGNGMSGDEGGEGEGGGGGGGGSSTPVAVIDITAADVRIEPITDSTRIAMSGIVLAAWSTFWLLWTVRTLARQSAKIRRLQIEKGLAG
ncbi:MAG TPA: spore germination protein GerW family protein [Dehalococcoidia bacterium]|nr:spore germination protein GerW family protein [Dehalococcoidia bacterium]